MKKKLSIVFLCAVIGISLFYLGSFYTKQKQQVIVEQPKNDLKLPTETTIKKITHQEVTSKLSEISEFACYRGDYSVSRSEEEARAILDEIKIPFTKNKITLACKGVVKIYYDLSKISMKLDHESHKIYINLPEQQVANYIDSKSLKCVEKNNVLNPIQFSQYKEIILALEQLGLKDVQNKGIHELAEKNIKNFIKEYLESSFKYKVVYL